MVSSFQAVSLLEEVLTPRKDLPPLLLKLNERPAERLDYLGVSYGLTPRLLKYVPALCTVLWLPCSWGPCQCLLLVPLLASSLHF